MTWVAVGMGVAGAVKGRQNEKRQKDLDKGRQAAIRYSWASGLKDPGMQNAGPGMLGSAMQGSIQGAMMSQALGKGVDAAATAAPSGGSMLGTNYDTGSWSGMANNIQQPVMNQATQTAASPVMGGGQQNPSWLAQAETAPDQYNLGVNKKFNIGGY